MSLCNLHQDMAETVAVSDLVAPGILEIPTEDSPRVVDTWVSLPTCSTVIFRLLLLIYAVQTFWKKRIALNRGQCDV